MQCGSSANLLFVVLLLILGYPFFGIHYQIVIFESGSVLHFKQKKVLHLWLQYAPSSSLLTSHTTLCLLNYCFPVTICIAFYIFWETFPLFGARSKPFSLRNDRNGTSSCTRVSMNLRNRFIWSIASVNDCNSFTFLSFDLPVIA